MRDLLARFIGDESGATSIEYGLIASLIFLVIVTTLTAFGKQASGIFNTAMIALRDGM